MSAACPGLITSILFLPVHLILFTDLLMLKPAMEALEYPITRKLAINYQIYLFISLYQIVDKKFPVTDVTGEKNGAKPL